MLFDENYGRSADHKHIEYKEAVTAICVNDKFVTIGFYNGLVEILSSEEHKVLNFLTILFNFDNMFYSFLSLFLETRKSLSYPYRPNI